MPRKIENKNSNAKLKQIKLEQESMKLALLKDKIAQKEKQSAPPKHTPYAEIPPPNDEEMRAVQDRLNALYDRFRAANELERRERLLSFAKDWP